MFADKTCLALFGKLFFTIYFVHYLVAMTVATAENRQQLGIR